MATDNPQIPGYRIDRRLGRGGMASVYLAEQQLMNRKVALKVMSNPLGDENIWAKRFIQEAQVIAQLTHPNVVPVYDVGTHEGKFYISMEYLKGGSLKDKMSKGLSVPEILKIIVGVAAGLDYAGEKGFVHRDIKPDNIMFRDDGSPVILDFGIVKQMDEGNNMTQSGVIVGTTSYMSPEQAQGRGLDQRSDIYSLGILLFELLTGRVPFKGDSDVGTLLKHINEPIPCLTGPLAVFQAVIDKALAKDFFHRYARACEFIDHIQALEPDIKTAIAALQDDEGEATVVQTRMLPNNKQDATLHNATGPVTTEEELTQVLSNAKATIRDFSAETRARRARRRKGYMFGIAMVAALALGYLAYYQWRIVPQERARAEAKIHQAALKTQNKIAALLAEAKTLRSGLLPTETEKIDKLIIIYRQVLQLDGDNKDANFNLQKLGERFLEMATNAARRRDVAKAIQYRDYAEQLVPDSGALPGLRNAIKSLRAKQLDKEFLQQEIATLMGVAAENIENSSGFSDVAHTKLQQVLALDPDNSAALQLFSTMMDNHFIAAEKDLAAKRSSAAKQKIDILKKYHKDTAKVAALEKQWQQRRAVQSKQREIRRLQTRAQQLLKEKRTIVSNDELRSTYLSMLAIDRGNASANNGLTDTSDFDAAIAEQAMVERDFARAERLLAAIAQHQPKYKNLASLQTQLKATQKASQQAESYLQEAQQLLLAATAANSDNKQNLLIQTYQKIDAARKLDRNHLRLDDVLVELESQYVVTIKHTIEEKNKILLDAYFKDTQGKEWPSDRIFQLKQLTNNRGDKKPKRVITGGF